ncbi:MAG TPA: MarR family transcriptional regulator [Ignavibacteria bacterium]|jgi:DNA-binding MarR family transcriptional regulator
MTTSPPVREELDLNIRAASAVIYGRFIQISESIGLTPSQYNVLRILKGVYPEGHARCEIAMRMIERSPDITRLIDRLEKRGLVERDRADEDRRMSITRITQKGLKLVNDLKPLIEKAHKEITKNLTDRECEKLSELLEKLYGHLL